MHPISKMNLAHNSAAEIMPSEVFDEHSGTFDVGGTPIYFRQRVPAKDFSPSEILNFIFVHGVSEHHGRHLLLPRFLEEKMGHNASFTWFDFRGHGRSGGRRHHVDNFDLFCDDFRAMVRFKGHFPANTKVRNIVFAHSMGGLVCLKSILDERQKLASEIEAIILSSPCIKAGPKLHPIVGDLLQKLGSFFPHIRVPKNTRGRELTRDIELATAYDCDQLIGSHFTLSLISEIIRACREIRPRSYFLDIPSLFLYGNDDTIIDHEIGKIFARGIYSDFRDIISYPGMKHELHNEIQREQVFQDIYQWLGQRKLI